MTITTHELIAGICKNNYGDACLQRKLRGIGVGVFCELKARLDLVIPQRASPGDIGLVALRRWGRTCLRQPM
jgi:hypothetical protein